jgi:hypothetical protein
MVYVVTYTTRQGRLDFCANNLGLARHTAKCDAERTLRDNTGKRNDLTLRAFKNMREAGRWACSNSGLKSI